MAFYMVKLWYKKQPTPIYNIYGAEQDGTSRSDQTRTDNAIGLADPNPYYERMSGSPSSPFDNISPQKDMRIVEDTDAGTLVEIPKFYYKQTRTGSAMKLQISMDQFPGSHISPAHADRGDGIGERDYVYIGRYHCGSNYKSQTGEYPANDMTREVCRTNIHNLGNYIQQNDYAIRQTINMLYLVEFADQNVQIKIGYGAGMGSKNTIGYTDSMPYHTGTTKTRKVYFDASSTQYRHIEGLQDNVYDQMDGIYFNNTDIYGIKNPANFSDSTGGTLIGTKTISVSGLIKDQNIPSVSGFEYALYPSSTDKYGDEEDYICDQHYYDASATVLAEGSNCLENTKNGLFCLYETTNKSSYIGSRLMVLPPSRLSPPQN